MPHTWFGSFRRFYDWILVLEIAAFIIVAVWILAGRLACPDSRVGRKSHLSGINFEEACPSINGIGTYP